MSHWNYKAQTQIINKNMLENFHFTANEYTIYESLFVFFHEIMEKKYFFWDVLY